MKQMKQMKRMKRMKRVKREMPMTPPRPVLRPQARPPCRQTAAPAGARPASAQEERWA